MQALAHTTSVWKSNIQSGQRQANSKRIFAGCEKSSIIFLGSKGGGTTGAITTGQPF